MTTRPGDGLMGPRRRHSDHNAIVQIPPIIEEAAKRSAVAWVDDRYLVWQLWHAGRMYVVSGGSEQPLSAGAQAVVALRSKDHRELVVRWAAAVDRVPPGSALWEEVVPLLHARRLNAPDGEDQPARWARESTVNRFTPTGQILPLAR